MQAVLVALLLAGNAAVVAPGGVLPRGARIVARMNTSIGTRRSLGVENIADETRAGAPFAATVDERVVDEHGATELPPGALLHGHIQRIERGHGVQRAVIELAVDRLDARPLEAHVVAAEVQQLPATDAGAEVDTTTFWGMLVGGLVFGVPGVAVGHGLAAGFGAVNTVRARVVEAWISAGSPITVELDEPLRIGRCLAAQNDVARC
jgi:hypothetical protein